MSLSWCAARFISGHEVAAAQKLNSDSYQRAFAPLYRRQWVHQGQKHDRLFPFFAGYIFIEMARFDAYRWHDVAEHKGFLGFVGGAAPLTEPPGKIEGLMERCSEEWVIEYKPDVTQESTLRRGDLVHLALDKDLVARVEWIEDDRTTAWVTVNGLFGRELRCKMAVEVLQKVEVKREKGRVVPLTEYPVVRQLVPA